MAVAKIESSTLNHLHIGALIFPDMDQSDFTGPFEVLSRIPNPHFTSLEKTGAPSETCTD